MSISDLAIVASMILSSISILSVVYIGGWRLGRLELQVATMWEFTLRRAHVEVVDSGFGTRNSPLRLNESATVLMSKMETELRALYAEMKKPVLDQDLALAIERQFGERIMDEVCIPNKLRLGACLIMAIGAAKNDPVVTAVYTKHSKDAR
jgi:hypothetical protein